LENGAAVEGFLYGMDPQNRSDKTGWYEKEVSSDNVPETVQKAWGTQNNKSEKYLLIRPFDTTYTLGEKENQGFTNLLAKPAYWFKYALSGEQAALKHVQKVKTSYVNKDLKVNVRAVGNMTSYNDKIVVMELT
jgi:hypothetical protein